MSKTTDPVATVLGARGGFGRHAVQAFAAAGWHVRALARSWDEAPVAGATPVEADATDREALTAACAGSDAIVHGINVPYPRWAAELPGLTANVVAAARAAGATLLVPGNVYNFGRHMPETLTESTPQNPTTRKGRLRRDMEATLRAAADNGLQVVILRAGDFIDTRQSGSWFDSYIAPKVMSQGKVMYPGPRDVRHAWAYLPDLTRAMAELAGQRGELSQFEVVGFPGYGLTGEQLIAGLEAVAGRKLTVTGLPWPALRVMGLWNPMMREVAEMKYLWDVPHAIDGGRFHELLPDFRITPLTEALAEALGVDAGATARRHQAA